MPTLFQAGTLIGILHGIYEGDVDFKTLLQHGDIGFGLLNGGDGEMLALDGNFYRIGEQGKAQDIDPDAYTPFSIISKFKPTHSFILDKISSIQELETLLASHLDTPNIFHMIRLDVELDWIKIINSDCKMWPQQLLRDNIDATSHSQEYENINGSLIITYCPKYSAAFTITGFHYHFINQTRNLGGHVTDLRIRHGKVMITPIRRFSMVLSHSKSFDEANLVD